MNVIVIKCALNDVAVVVRSIEDMEAPLVGLGALGILKRVDLPPPTDPAAPLDPNVTYLHFTAKLGTATACGKPTDLIGHPTQTWATDKWEAVDCPECLRRRAMFEVANPGATLAPPAPSAPSTPPGRILVKFAPTTDAKHVCQQVGLSLCGLKVSPNMVAPTIDQTDCRECRYICERQFPAMPRAVGVYTTWSVERGAGPVKYALMSDDSILLGNTTFIEQNTPHHTALCKEWLTLYPPQNGEPYERYTIRERMKQIIAQSEAGEQVKRAAAGWPGAVPAAAPVAPPPAEPNPFAAVAAETDKLVEAQKRFDSLVGLWLQNFGTDSPAQPDRQGTLVGTFAGYGAGVVWKHIETKGGLARAVLDSIVRNSWASQEAKEGVPSRTKLAKIVALNMVQVGSALGFPLHDYIEACVMHTPGEVKPDGSREPDDTAIMGPMCREAKDTK